MSNDAITPEKRMRASKAADAFLKELGSIDITVEHAMNVIATTAARALLCAVEESPLLVRHYIITNVQRTFLETFDSLLFSEGHIT
jgi:hypothetical protein